MSTVTLVPLSKDAIDRIFEEAKVQGDYLIALYRAAYPFNWNEIAKVVGWPRVGPRTHKYLFEKAVEFDHKHHPNVMAGGMWGLNNGFGCRDDVPEWFVEQAEVELA